LLVAGRIRRDLAELDVVPRVGGAIEHDAVFRVEELLRRVERPLGVPAVLSDAGHHAKALRFDEYLSLVALLAADLLSKEVVRAEKPFAVPPVLEDRL